MTSALTFAALFTVLAFADPKGPEALDEYKQLAATVGRGADAQVRLALWCESHGLEAARVKHLFLAVTASPDHVLARALLGLVRDGSKWRKPEEVAEKIRADEALSAALAEYNARRERTPDTATAHWGLALWCEQKGLKAETMAHLTIVTRLDPTFTAAWIRLGCKRHNNRWLKPEQIAAEKAEAEAQQKADTYWFRHLKILKPKLTNERLRGPAELELSELSDPRAVRAVWQLFVTRSELDQSRAVDLFSQLDGTDSAVGLSSLAVYSSFPTVRTRATEALARRDAREAVDRLIGMIVTPLKYEVRPVNGPGRPGALYVEGELFNISRIYDAPLPPVLPPVSLLIPDSPRGFDAEPFPGGRTALLTAYQNSFTHGSVHREEQHPQPAQPPAHQTPPAHQPESHAPQAQPPAGTSQPFGGSGNFGGTGGFGATPSFGGSTGGFGATQNFGGSTGGFGATPSFGGPGGIPSAGFPDGSSGFGGQPNFGTGTNQGSRPAVRWIPAPSPFLTSPANSDPTFARDRETEQQWRERLRREEDERPRRERQRLENERAARIEQNWYQARLAAASAQQVLEADLAAVEGYNLAVAEINARVLPVLQAATGRSAGPDRQAWKAWWADQRGYSYNRPNRPTFEYHAGNVYQPIFVAIPSTSASCFGLGTPVRTAEGTRPIESLRVGDRVLTQDTKTGALSYQPVLGIFHNRPAPTLKIDLGGESVVATPIHRFWRAGRGWALARELKPGDVVRTIGGTATVGEILVNPVQPVFNFEVAESHTFFVGARGALVHDHSPFRPHSRLFDVTPTLTSMPPVSTLARRPIRSS